MTEMFEYEWNGQYAPLIADDVYKVIQDNACGVSRLTYHLQQGIATVFWIQNIRTFLFA
jgi:hypothetical protein